MHKPYLPKGFNFLNILTIIFVVLISVLLINPNAKALLIQGFMKIGLYQPNRLNQIDNSQIQTNKVQTGVLLKNENGKVFDLGDLKSKVVSLNFWATWCPPCIAEMPSINRLQNRFKDNKDILILVVNADNQMEKSKKFMSKKGYDLNVLHL